MLEYLFVSMENLD